MSAIRIRVRAFPELGFYRGHRFWPNEWVEDEVSDDALKVLQAEKNLAVEVVGRTAEVDDEPKRPASPARPPRTP